MLQWHPCQASTTTWVIEWTRLFCNVGNAVFKLHEYIWAMVDAQPITSTKVLVDPHVHEERNYT
jgi:hypothetical protein